MRGSGLGGAGVMLPIAAIEPDAGAIATAPLDEDDDLAHDAIATSANTLSVDANTAMR